MESDTGSEELEKEKEKLQKEFSEKLKKILKKEARIKFSIQSILDIMMDTEYADE